jgi:hypothetical protein
MTTPNFEYSGEELEVMSLAHNYRRYWMSKLPSLPIDSHVLEVGAGIGSNVVQLLEMFNKVSLIEPDKGQEAILRDKFKNQVKTGKLDIYSGYHEMLSSDKFDLILYIDVLEHIESDLIELQLASSKLQSDGRLFLVVPAFQALFSNYDRKLSHHRRYSKKSLRCVTPSNLEIESLFFLDSVGLLGVALNRILHNTNLSQVVVRVWDVILIPVSKVLDHFIFKHSFGKSIVLIAKKK